MNRPSIKVGDKFVFHPEKLSRNPDENRVALTLRWVIDSLKHQKKNGGFLVASQGHTNGAVKALIPCTSEPSLGITKYRFDVLWITPYEEKETKG